MAKTMYVAQLDFRFLHFLWQTFCAGHVDLHKVFFSAVWHDFLACSIEEIGLWKL